MIPQITNESIKNQKSLQSELKITENSEPPDTIPVNEGKFIEKTKENLQIHKIWKSEVKYSKKFKKLFVRKTYWKVD